MSNVIGPFLSREGGLIVRRMPSPPVSYAVFGRVLPRPEQVEEVVTQGFGVHFIGSGSDLNFLRVRAGGLSLGNRSRSGHTYYLEAA